MKAVGQSGVSDTYSAFRVSWWYFWISSLQQLAIWCIRGFSVLWQTPWARDLTKVFTLASGSSSWVYNSVGRRDSRWLECEAERSHLQQQAGSRAKELEPSSPWWQTSSSKAASPHNLTQQDHQRGARYSDSWVMGDISYSNHHTWWRLWSCSNKVKVKAELVSFSVKQKTKQTFYL